MLAPIKISHANQSMLRTFRQNAVAALESWQAAARAVGLPASTTAIPRLVHACRGTDLTGRKIRFHQAQDRYFSRHDVKDALSNNGDLKPQSLFEVFVGAGMIPKGTAKNLRERQKCIHRLNRHLISLRENRSYNKPDTKKRPNAAIRRAVAKILRDAA